MELGDEWKKEYSSSSEAKSKTELEWMRRYSPAREFLLVARIEKKKKINYDPDLNDHIPF